MKHTQTTVTLRDDFTGKVVTDVTEYAITFQPTNLKPGSKSTRTYKKELSPATAAAFLQLLRANNSDAAMAAITDFIKEFPRSVGMSSGSNGARRESSHNGRAYDSTIVRAWAKENGKPEGEKERGRISTETLDAYFTANPVNGQANSAAGNSGGRA